MEKICKNCNILFKVTRNKRKNIFCSKSCYTLNHYTETICKVCFIKFSHHKTKKRIFCSISCSNKNRNENRTRNCNNCKKIFELTALNRGNKYCCKQCYFLSGEMSIKKIGNKNANFIDGKYRYRATAFRELPNLCAICTSTENLEVHHIDHNNKNGFLNNLIILCHECHVIYHRYH